MPKPTLRPDGRWMIQLPRNGKSRRCVYGRTEDEAIAKYNAAIGAGAVKVRPGSISEFVVTTFTGWIKGRVKPNSFNRYDSLWRIQLGPKIGSVLFSELTPELIQDVLSTGASASTRQNAKGLLSQIVKLAIAKGMCAHEVGTMVSLASVGSRPVRETRDIASKVKEFFDSVQGHWLEGPVYCGMMLGLRRAEVCGLMPGDIDLANGRLTIRRQRRTSIDSSLKNKAEGAARRFAVPKSVLDRLLSYHQPGTIFLFSMPDGRPLDYERIGKTMQAIQKGDRVTFHDLRRATVSALVDAGIDDHTIMEITGHTTRDMIRRYRDLRDRRTASAIEKLSGE